MISLGPIGFAAPLALIALIALPLLWLLLRATPPAPRHVVFAPLRLLQRLAQTPQTPQSAPWWLIMLRLLMAAIVVIALAQPVWRPDDGARSDLPVLVVVDNGWQAAQGWPRTLAQARAYLESANAQGRRAALALTASQSEIVFENASAALARLDGVRPQSWSPDRADLATRLEDALSASGAPSRFDSWWLSDGVAGEGDTTLARLISQRGRLVVSLPGGNDGALALRPVSAAADGFEAEIIRSGTSGTRDVTVSAVGQDGQVIARAPARFEDGRSTARAEARLPLDLRNRLASVRLEGVSSAGAVQLLDDSWQRPRIALIEPEGGENRQPLLSDLHYAQQALAPYAEIVRGPLETVLEEEPSGLVMVDAARNEDPSVLEFVERGGLLIRFAGPRLAAREDSLLPVRLRQGGRLLGGALNWEEPQTIAPFGDDSPFAGLSISGDATIRSQVLAEPEADLDRRVWARLADGTPLVTADRRGEGWVVLFHITAGPDWSGLPLTGTFPAMLRRVLALAEGAGTGGAGSEGSWQIERMLDGTGRLRAPTGNESAIPADAFDETPASPTHPPGIWRLGAASAALNAVRADTVLSPMARDLPGALYEIRDGVREQRLAGPLLALAALLLALDMIIALAFAGRLPGLPASRLAGLAMAVLIGGAVLAPAAEAQDTDIAEALDRALEVRFGYVMTGNREVDAVSRAGLAALSREVTARSAIEPEEPRGVDLDDDELIFFPLIYWPVTPDAQPVSERAARNINTYLLSGGMIIFDTRDGAAGTRGGAHPGLERVMQGLEIPALARADTEHVLSRTFYLLREYPGRIAGTDIWVEANPDGAARDGVSGVIIGSADWAGAWARAESGNPMFPVEGGERQREMSYRFGVNLAMYALTGNYKTDQVHVPAILERLGQGRRGPPQRLEP
ncbi:MAG: DUF4159 domain-containing protein [Oceanicaulis sp.]|uniref:DUF4159 domain-containing protein n=1 Tax=Glycocaulis sp. TaxID=1969725 RepID=UPI0025BD9759|nr:DUF4159 domain-containing protein [Glycocaulis sp.]MCC5980527.1 DUF4159 domain-containing protein [Oceanicaulis sp.]MCH8521490.1 DUF4159 domain-containing protein [Glycocaulis sp.]